MNRSRHLVRSFLAGLAMVALAGVASTAHADAPGATDPATTTAPTAPAPSAAPASAAPAASATPVEGAPAEASTGHRTAWPWIIIGVGVALVVTATVLEVHAVSEDDQRQSAEIKLTGLPQGDPQRAALVDAAASHDHSASTTRTQALVIGSVGFVAVAGAVVLWFVEGGSSSASSAGATASAAHGASTANGKRGLPSIVPQLAPGYAGAMLGASF